MPIADIIILAFMATTSLYLAARLFGLFLALTSPWWTEWCTKQLQKLDELDKRTDELSRRLTERNDDQV